MPTVKSLVKGLVESKPRVHATAASQLTAAAAGSFALQTLYECSGQNVNTSTAGYIVRGNRASNMLDAGDFTGNAHSAKRVVRKPCRALRDDFR
jgi:hypothetical protein